MLARLTLQLEMVQSFIYIFQSAPMSHMLLSVLL